MAKAGKKIACQLPFNIIGLVKYPLGHGEGCATIVLLYTYTESVEKKIMTKKGKKRRRKENEKSPDLAGFELGTVGL